VAAVRVAVHQPLALAHAHVTMVVTLVRLVQTTRVLRPSRLAATHARPSVAGRNDAAVASRTVVSRLAWRLEHHGAVAIRQTLPDAAQRHALHTTLRAAALLVCRAVLATCRTSGLQTNLHQQSF
jgi:succinate dehydrogenase hydrophobic anchor subunit